jgi:DNA-binding response OmpR family regulator
MIGSIRKKIIVASRNSTLAEVRKHVLEEAVFTVLQISSINQIRDVCEQNKVALSMLGSSLPPAEKRRAALKIREHCKCPILELTQTGIAEVDNISRLYHHLSETPEDFVQTVVGLLSHRKKRIS